MRQIERMFDVAALREHGTRERRRRPAAAAHLRLAAAREERMKEIGERILVAEQIAHLLRRHRAIAALAAPAAAAAEIRVPLGRDRIRPPGTAAGALRLLVHLPVRAQLVVFLALVGIADDLVRFVDLLEPRFGRLVARD